MLKTTEWKLFCTKKYVLKCVHYADFSLVFTHAKDEFLSSGTFCPYLFSPYLPHADGT